MMEVYQAEYLKFKENLKNVLSKCIIGGLIGFIIMFSISSEQGFSFGTTFIGSLLISFVTGGLFYFYPKLPFLSGSFMGFAIKVCIAMFLGMFVTPCIIIYNGMQVFRYKRKLLD